MITTELPYQQNSTVLFNALAHLDHAVFLDSCFPYHDNGRYDIIAAEPIMTISTEGTLSQIQTPESIKTSNCTPFELTKEQLETLKPNTPLPIHLPFATGAIGYFSYDVGRQLETLPLDTIHDIKIPNAVIHFYDWSIIIDHQEQKTYFVTRYEHQHPRFQYIKKLFASKPKTQTPFKITKTFQSNMTQQDYKKAFNRLQYHIHEGNCYQANLCQRFTGEYQGAPWQAFQYLRKHHPAPYAAYMKLKKGYLLSFSPERFLQVKNNSVETKPIKGTCPRYSDPQKDQASAEQLINSLKDKAENLMIVDLLRNDLGKCCRPGSIRVPKLFALESFSNVHHLVSTITGKLDDKQQALDLLRHCFPGGSITGTPKLRAMEIIESLEPHHRSAYCGSIGYFDVNGNMDSNIMIRTLLLSDNKIHCYAGGAIVSDSKAENEYQETLDKVSKLISLLENM